MLNDGIIIQDWRRKVVICTVLLMMSLGILRRESVFDMPHLHSDPAIPTNAVSMLASANSTATVTTFSWAP